MWPLVWILCLAMLSVGARNFEEGLSIDAPVYASRARHIAEGGSWWQLDAKVPDREILGDHPHLGVWFVAAIFKVLPVADWSARLAGHLLYVVFLWMFFLFVRYKSGDKTAALSVILLWSFHLFSNTFSNVYLDPGCVVFGTASFFLLVLAFDHRRLGLASLSGLAFAGSFLYKDLAALGYLPAMAALPFLYLNKREGLLRFTIRASAMFLVTFVPIILVYGYFCQKYAPGYLDMWWTNQILGRVRPLVQSTSVVFPEYWKKLSQYTNHLIIIAPLALLRARDNKVLIAVFIIAVTFALMFTKVALAGGQYTINVLPWAAWLIAEALTRFIPLGAPSLVRASTVISIVAVFVIQYLPFRTHAVFPLSDYAAVRRLKEKAGIKEITVDMMLPNYKFLAGSRFVWYGHVPVVYGDGVPVPKATPERLYFVSRQFMDMRAKELKQQGWCLDGLYDMGQVWKSCDLAE